MTRALGNSSTVVAYVAVICNGFGGGESHPILRIQSYCYQGHQTPPPNGTKKHPGGERKTHVRNLGGAWGDVGRGCGLKAASACPLLTSSCSQGYQIIPYNGKMPGQVFSHCKNNFVGAKVWLEGVQGRSPWLAELQRRLPRRHMGSPVDLTHLPKNRVQANTPCYSAPCRTCQPCQSKRRSKGSGLLTLET